MPSQILGDEIGCDSQEQQGRPLIVSFHPQNSLMALKLRMLADDTILGIGTVFNTVIVARSSNDEQIMGPQIDPLIMHGILQGNFARNKPPDTMKAGKIGNKWEACEYHSLRPMHHRNETCGTIAEEHVNELV